MIEFKLLTMEEFPLNNVILEVVSTSFLLILLLFGDYKILPIIGRGKTKDNFFLRNLKFAEFFIVLRIVYLLYITIRDYVFM